MTPNRFILLAAALCAAATPLVPGVWALIPAAVAVGLLTSLALRRPPAPAKSSERRAAIMFLDVRDFTLLTARMESREIFAVANRLMAEVIPQIERHGGRVEKLLGDGLMASFGLDRDLPSPALRAVRCALEVQQDCAWLNCTDAYRKSAACVEPVRIEIGIGIAKGRVFTGPVGAGSIREIAAMGRTVNLASRLCALAGRGEVRCCNFTWLDIRDEARFHRGASVEMKGITEPIKTYLVEGLAGIKAPDLRTTRRRKQPSLDDVDPAELATRVVRRIPEELRRTRLTPTTAPVATNRKRA